MAKTHPARSSELNPAQADNGDRSLQRRPECVAKKCLKPPLPGSCSGSRQVDVGCVGWTESMPCPTLQECPKVTQGYLVMARQLVGRATPRRTAMYVGASLGSHAAAFYDGLCLVSPVDGIRLDIQRFGYGRWRDCPPCACIVAAAWGERILLGHPTTLAGPILMHRITTIRLKSRCSS